VGSEPFANAIRGIPPRSEIRADNGRFHSEAFGPRRKRDCAIRAERGIPWVSRRAGHGKKTTPEGHDLVNRKKIVNRKDKLQEKSTISSEQAEIIETLEISDDPRTSKAVKEGLRDLKAGRVRPYREFAKELLIWCRIKGQV